MDRMCRYKDGCMICKCIVLLFNILLVGMPIYSQELEIEDFLPKAVSAFDRLTQGYSKARIVREIEKKNVRWMTNLMSASAVLYRATGQVAYLDMAEEVFKTAVVAWQKNDKLMMGQDDFFALRHLTDAYRVLKENGRVGPQADSIMVRFADLHFQPDYVIDHNRGQARALGFARMCRLFPNALHAEQWRKYVNEVWECWYRNKDVDEAATLYASIHLNDIISIAAETGRIAQLKTPEIKKWFVRYRMQQAPSGYMPEYGDDYFFAYYHWILAFEKMARLTGDSSFRWAAWKLFTIGYQNLDEKKYFKQAWNPRQACDWAVLVEVALLPAFNGEGTSWDGFPVVTTRTDRNGEEGKSDQLLLRTSVNPGASFVMSDLYAAGTHAHSNLRGSVTYFEVDDNPFFHGLQRHATDVRHGNTVVVMKDSVDGFPFGSRQSRWLTDVWFSDFVDFSRSTKISSNPFMRGMKRLTFRFQGEPGEIIYLKNVRLMGAAGERKIPEALDGKCWSRNATLLDCGDRENMIKIVLSDRNVTFVNLDVAMDFDLKEYRYIGCDWKHIAVMNKQKSKLDFMIRAYNKLPLPDEEYVHDEVGTLCNSNILKVARVEQKRKDAYGQIVLADHCVEGTELQRNMVLTEEGILILQDCLQVGPNTEGYVAGSLWQLYSLEESGENWFESAGEAKQWRGRDGLQIDRNRLFVYFDKQKKRNYGFQQQEFTVKPITIYAKQPIIPGEHVVFVMVLIPHTLTWRAVDIARSVFVQTDKNEYSKVNIVFPDKRELCVELSKDGMWNVFRK